MLDMSNNNDVTNAPVDLQIIAETFQRALISGCMVELRIEDLPEMDMDSILKTKLTSVKIDEKDKGIWIEAEGLHLMFQYEEYSMGSSSVTHDKFYFKSKNASLTITVRYN